ncbi:hypothetical protein B0H11DRAFT_2234890 [Mycena galericulata]|nr:hypothetical protein B0H11DRAFT_2234890 [Mycena galericulata]
MPPGTPVPSGAEEEEGKYALTFSSGARTGPFSAAQCSTPDVRARPRPRSRHAELWCFFTQAPSSITPPQPCADLECFVRRAALLIPSIPRFPDPTPAPPFLRCFHLHSPTHRAVQSAIRKLAAIHSARNFRSESELRKWPTGGMGWDLRRVRGRPRAFAQPAMPTPENVGSPGAWAMMVDPDADSADDAADLRLPRSSERRPPSFVFALSSAPITGAYLPLGCALKGRWMVNRVGTGHALN